MNNFAVLLRIKGFRFPRAIIPYAVWAYHCFNLSAADVEDLLAGRGVTVSLEAIRLWVNRFGRHLADCIRRDRPQPNDKWHMDNGLCETDETIVSRSVHRRSSGCGVLDILVLTSRNAKVAKSFFKRLVARFDEPRVVITPLVTLLRNALSDNGQVESLHTARQLLLATMREANRSQHWLRCYQYTTITPRPL